MNVSKVSVATLTRVKVRERVSGRESFGLFEDHLAGDVNVEQVDLQRGIRVRIIGRMG